MKKEEKKTKKDLGEKKTIVRQKWKKWYKNYKKEGKKTKKWFWDGKKAKKNYKRKKNVTNQLKKKNTDTIHKMEENLKLSSFSPFCEFVALGGGDEGVRSRSYF